MPTAARPAHNRAASGREDAIDPKPDAAPPVRVIGGAGGIAIVAGSMLGIGIFLTPPIVASHTSSLAVYLGIWLFGGLAALAGAVAYAEQGAMLPRAGGEYVFLREAFGPSWAFASGTTIFGAIFAGSIATLATALFQYQVPDLVAPLVRSVAGPGASAGLDAPWLGPIKGAQALAVVLVVALTGLNVLGARASAAAQTAFVAVPIAVLSVFGAYGLVVGGWPEAPAGGTGLGLDPESLALSYLPVYFAYSGWNAVIYVAGEVRDPGRNLPLGLVGGTLLVTGLYALLCLAFVAVLGMGGLAGAGEAGTATARALGGPVAGYLVTAVIAVGLLGCLNGAILGGARVAYALARDGAFWSGAATTGRSGAPTRALWLQAAWSSVLILTGTFEQVLNLASLAMQFIGSLAVLSLFVLRARRPALPRPYRATGYPWLPASYLAGGAVVVTVMLARPFVNPGPGAWYPAAGLGIFLVAWAVHRTLSRPAS